MSAAVPPPPPSLVPSPTFASTRPWYPDGNNPDATWVKKVLMIAGLVAGFTMYLVPGFFGVRTYRQWKRGEAPTPLGWMTFGVAYWLFFAFVVYTIATDGLEGM